MMRIDLEIQHERIVPYETEDDLHSKMDEKEDFYAIIFDMNETISNPPIPQNFSYIIRIKNNNFRTHEVYHGDVFDANNRGRYFFIIKYTKSSYHTHILFPIIFYYYCFFFGNISSG